MNCLHKLRTLLATALPHARHKHNKLSSLIQYRLQISQFRNVLNVMALRRVCVISLVVWTNIFMKVFQKMPIRFQMRLEMCCNALPVPLQEKSCRGMILRMKLKGLGTDKERLRNKKMKIYFVLVLVTIWAWNNFYTHVAFFDMGQSPMTFQKKSNTCNTRGIWCIWPFFVGFVVRLSVRSSVRSSVVRPYMDGSKMEKWSPFKQVYVAIGALWNAKNQN